jgi:quinolinate synthase
MIDPTLPFPPARHERDGVLARLARVVPAPEIAMSLPLLDAIGELKAARDAVIVAHNYQVPLISAGVADFVGDSLAMARFAAECAASVICVCGVYFMAETVKLLCPDKRVLLPNLLAGCSLAESITAEDVAALRRCHPHFPVVAYVSRREGARALFQSPPALHLSTKI